MNKTLALIIGLTLAASAFTVSAQSARGNGRGQGQPAGRPCEFSPRGQADKDCPYYGQGPQRRHGQGQVQGQRKGFRGGPRDGSGPRRDGSCGQCLNKL